jgi:hypothetical protein
VVQGWLKGTNGGAVWIGRSEIVYGLILLRHKKPSQSNYHGRGLLLGFWVELRQPEEKKPRKL